MTERNNPVLRARSIRWLVLLLLLSLGTSLGQLEHPDRPALSRNMPHDRGSGAIAHFLPIAGPFQPDGPQPMQLGEAGNAAIPDDWYNTVMADIAASEYHINWQEGVGAFQSPNRKQDLRITYRADGFDLWPRTDSAAWQVHLALDRIGKPGAWLLPSDSATLSTNGPDLVADHGAFTMDYHNAEDGMRQNFTVRERPAGDGPLQVRLNYSGDLHATDKGSNAIAFCTPVEGTSSYVPTLWYKDLHVWDANGDTLQATAMLDGEDVVISVHDAFAEYPITVDPLSTTANWTAESDQVDAHFGACVASAGDVNGDGYSDVIIGAPEYDNGETDEGRAYVYFGSANGLISASPWSAEGNSTGALFGTAVSSAGDVNNDGFSDIVVGSPGFSNGQNSEGRIQVYHGSATGPAATANRTIESNSVLSRMGASVALAGDVNNDGYSDVIVGSPDYSNGQTTEGRAQVFQGSAGGLSAAASWWHESDQINAREGWSVSGAGDVNGDGYSDIIVGAILFDNGQTNEGRAFVFHGGFGGLAAAAAWTAESDQASAQFGYGVACAGDVNGDGYSDVIVGAPKYDNGQTDEGRAFVYHGSAAGLGATAAWTAESNQISANFAAVVACAGDVNGDGFSDVIIGADSYDNGQTDEGRAYMYLGSATGLLLTADWTAESDQANAAFGWWVASAGDVNGDGYSDVIVGAREYNGGQAQEGRVFVYQGGAAGLSSTANWTAESDQVGANFGYSVSSAGDVNGDGYSDVIVGAIYFDNGQLNEGRAFVYHGSALGLSAIANWTAESDQANAQFGYSVSSAGDVNGDGYSDVIVGAIHFDNGQGNEGRAFVYHGSALGLSAIANWTAESDQANALFGWSVSSAGDVNGDGYSDVIVGAPNFENGQNAEGRAFVYHGSALGLSAIANWTAESDQVGANFGYSVSSAGDVNGDGYSDLIVGASGYDNGQTNEGRAFVYHGSALGLSAIANWTAESDQANAQFGYSVSSAGDVNGDGYSDVIVGAKLFDNGQTYEGRAFVYHGNNGTGRRHNMRLYNTNLTAPISASNIPNAQFGMGLYAKPFLGRQRTRMVWETRSQGQAFSSAGGRITNSTASTAQQAATTQTAVAGTELKALVDKVLTSFPVNATKVRARLRYSLVTALTGQVYGPWRYMPGYLDGHGTHNNIPLPVEMLYFSADCQQGKPLLQWATASERNSSHFSVQRSADGNVWETVGAMPAAGSSQQVVEYRFVDPRPSSEALVYYRLRQVDLDGREELFDMVLMMNCGYDEVALIAYPNPAGDVVYLTTTLSTGAEGRHTLELMDGTGRVVMATGMDLSTGQGHTALELTGLAQGSYVIALRNGSGSVLARTRVVKQ